MKKKAAKVPNEAKIAKLVKELLVELGEDPGRDGLKKTPERVARSLSFLTRGYRQDIAKVVNGARFKSGTNHMVILKDIELYSLSKLARIVDMYARRLQIQERMTEEIANAVMAETGAEGVGVVIKAKHLCMMMRGVEKQNSEMTTSAVLGTFRTDEKVRQEFLSLIK